MFISYDGHWNVWDGWDGCLLTRENDKITVPIINL